MSRLNAPGSSRLSRPGLKPSLKPGHPVPPQGRLSSASNSSSLQRTSPKESTDSGATTPIPMFDCGDRVVVGGTKQGTVGFIGVTQFARGIWVGVILDTPDGKNSGSVNGISYFNCEPNHGLFSKPDKLVLVKKAVSNTQYSQVPTQSFPPAPIQSDEAQLTVGDRVLIDGIKSGVILFIGPTQFAKGIWIGVRLDQPEGKNDGSVNGVQYFECPPLYGVFTRAAKVILQPQQRLTPVTAKRPRPAPIQVSDEEIKLKTSQLIPGDRVMVNGNKEGTLRFIGTTHFAKGIWVGVELDIAQGKNDGAVSGKRYFQCEPMFGLFAPLPKVEKTADAAQQMIRKHSESSVSSMSSLSSMGKFKQLQQQMGDSGPPVRGISSPINPLASMNNTDNLSHILFEKDHQIATLQSGLDQSEQEKMKLLDQVTDYKRQVDDLHFRLEELSVISGDQLEKVVMRDDGELDDLRKELETEQEKNAALKAELSTVLANQQPPQESSSQEVQTLTEDMKQQNNKIQELEHINISLRDELSRLKQELQSAESDYNVTETAAGSLQTDLDTTQQQLQETLDLCAQQETLLEEKVKELETFDDQNRNLMKDIDRMVSERQQLISNQEQVSAERDQALKQYEDIMSQSLSVTNEQTQLARQRSDLLQERDQARAELRDHTVLLEQIVSERDELQKRLDEILELRDEAQGRTQKYSLQLDTTQTELQSAQIEIDKLKREVVTLKEDKENDKVVSEQKIELANATSSELRERLNRATEELDSALSQAQILSDKYNKKENQVEELQETIIGAQNQIQTLEEQLEEVIMSNDKLLQDNQMESGVIQEQLEEFQELFELKERELQEAKEKIVCLEEELVIYQSSGSGLQDDQRIVELEEERLLLEEKLSEQTTEIQQLSTTVKQQQSVHQQHGGNGDVQLLQEKEQEINFLKSVITDQQTKIETLEALNGLGDNVNGGIGYLDSSEDDILGNQLPPPRLYCDICDEFDQHDTGDCPLQAQDPDDSYNTQHHAHRSHERPYCDNCEVFGHWTDECDFEETY